MKEGIPILNSDFIDDIIDGTDPSVNMSEYKIKDVIDEQHVSVNACKCIYEHLSVDNVVVDAFKLILLNYSNFSIAKIVVNKIERVK